MSQVYNLEPPTDGKVVLKTSKGDLDIELWPKHAPLAVRNFVQLCLEGYYDNTTVHRIVRNYLIQAGDPTGTGQGGESIYGGTFKDEVTGRLRFSNRGIVACCNQNAPDTNGSQFFITLDRADHLNKKSTIFGKVTGDTRFNLERFNEVDTTEDDCPVEKIVIHKALVAVNPFDDIIPRTFIDQKKAIKSQKVARKSVKNAALISFEEDNDDYGLIEPIKRKHPSSQTEKDTNFGKSHSEELKLHSICSKELNGGKPTDRSTLEKSGTKGPLTQSVCPEGLNREEADDKIPSDPKDEIQTKTEIPIIAKKKYIENFEDRKQNFKRQKISRKDRDKRTMSGIQKFIGSLPSLRGRIQPELENDTDNQPSTMRLTKLLNDTY